MLLLQISGTKETGVYGAAYGFLGPLIFLPAAVMGSFFPVLSAIHKHDPHRADHLVQVCADVMAAIGLPILAGAIALSDRSSTSYTGANSRGRAACCRSL